MAVRFGLAIRNFVGPGETPDVDAILGYAERAEALGFESLWAWDHILLGVKPAFPVLDAPSILTAIAVRTSRVRLGTGVFVLPLRNPVVTAKVFASLDQISKGRLLFGVAAGWYAREFDAVGIPFKARGRIFERNLDLVVRLWTEEAVTAQVDGLNLREAVLLPRPVQTPRPPVLIGGYVDAVLRRAKAVPGPCRSRMMRAKRTGRKRLKRGVGGRSDSPATMSVLERREPARAESRGGQVLGDRPRVGGDDQDDGDD